MNNKHIIGNFERVSFPEFGIDNVVAKIDTGADSGSLHCTNIIVNTKGKKREIQFSPFDHPEIVMKLSHYSVGHVKSSNGNSEKRYFITTLVAISGMVLPVNLSLSDRSTMKYPVLLGNRFLQRNKFLVDVSLDNS